jgi:hypothetical protein
MRASLASASEFAQQRRYHSALASASNIVQPKRKRIASNNTILTIYKLNKSEAVNSTPPKTFPLVRLCPELRQKVFLVALFEHERTTPDVTPALIKALRPTTNTSNVYYEALEVYYRRKIFTINHKNVEAVQNLLPETKLMVSHISLVFRTVISTAPKFEDYIKYRLNRNSYDVARTQTALKRIKPTPIYSRTLAGFNNIRTLHIDSTDVPHNKYQISDKLDQDMISLIKIQGGKYDSRLWQVEHLVHQHLPVCKLINQLSVTTGEFITFEANMNATDQPLTYTTHHRIKLDDAWVDEMCHIVGKLAKLQSVTARAPEMLVSRGWGVRTGPLRPDLIKELYRSRITWVWDAGKGTTLG